MHALDLEKPVVNNRALVARLIAESGFCRSNEYESLTVIEFLDRVIPLDGPSHAQVVRYTVEIPMRYAQCFATLEDGAKIGLRDPRQFIGWIGREESPTLIQLGILDPPFGGHRGR